MSNRGNQLYANFLKKIPTWNKIVPLKRILDKQWVSRSSSYVPVLIMMPDSQLHQIDIDQHIIDFYDLWEMEYSFARKKSSRQSSSR